MTNFQTSHRFTRRTAAGLLCAFAAMSAVAQTGGNPIRVGMSAPFTGPQAAFGKELRDGIQACLAKANERGAVQGRTVELVALDDGGEPQRTAANTRTLVADPKVIGLIGYVGAETTEAALPQIAAARIPLIGVVSGAESLRTRDNRQVFHLRAGHREESVAIVTQLDHMGIERIAVLYQNDSLGNDGLVGANDEMSRLALRPTTVSRIEPNGSDAARAAKEVAADSPSAVILITNQRAAAQFVRAMKAIGQHPRYLAISEAGGGLLAKDLGPLARGIGLSQVMPLPTSTVRPLVRDYQAAVRGTGKEDFGYYSLEGCVYASVAVEALRRAGREPSRERLQQVLEIGEYDLGNFRLRFNGPERRGSTFTEMTVITSEGRIAR